MSHLFSLLGFFILFLCIEPKTVESALVIELPSPDILIPCLSEKGYSAFLEILPDLNITDILLTFEHFFPLSRSIVTRYPQTFKLSVFRLDVFLIKFLMLPMINNGNNGELDQANISNIHIHSTMSFLKCSIWSSNSSLLNSSLRQFDEYISSSSPLPNNIRLDEFDSILDCFSRIPIINQIQLNSTSIIHDQEKVAAQLQRNSIVTYLSYALEKSYYNIYDLNLLVVESLHQFSSLIPVDTLFFYQYQFLFFGFALNCSTSPQTIEWTSLDLLF